MKLPAFAASPATLEFHRQLVAEHVDEAAFLYGQRCAMLEEPDAPWVRLAGVEQRIEAHLDALAIVGRGPIEGAGSGALFVAACVACRRRESARLGQVFDLVQEGEEADLAPLRDALRVEMPGEWMPLVLERLSASRPAWVALLAELARPGQPAVARALLKALQHGIALCGVAAAAGRLRIDAARQELWRCLADDRAPVRAAALLALCRIGDGEAMPHALAIARAQPWARAVVGLGGGSSAVRTLLEIADGGAADAATLEALGLLGDPAAVPALLAALARQGSAAAAARALQWITGAALFEETFVADPVDEAALSPSELQHWKARQEAPTRSDGQPFGEHVRVPSRDPQRWERWLREHAGAFQSGRRYRAGRPCTPGAIVDSLADPHTEGRLRRAAALELEIRFGCTIPLDVGMPVAAQRAALARLRPWAEALGARQWTC